jgi:hypothetical protein
MTEDTGLLGRLEEKLASIQRDFSEQKVVADERWRKIEPVLMERSGELQRMKDFYDDLNSLGKKQRESDDRISRMVENGEARAQKLEGSIRHIEARQNRIFWMVTGGFAVLQLLWLLVGDALQNAAGHFLNR